MNKRPKIQIYDCTLREGAQAPHISFSLQDKLRITEILDDLGIAYSEGGWPAANPKDLAYFHELRHLSLKHLKVVGFASTFTPKNGFHAEENVRTFQEAGIEAIHLFGKAWDFHVHHVLNIGLQENLECIYNSIRFFKKHIAEVSFGAEHLFDGYKANPEYVVQLLQTVEEAGADWIDLPDTNGGSFPHQIGATVAALKPVTNLPLAVHCHDDTGCAVANTIAAIQNGVTIAEGTINGYAERCEMTDLCTLIPNLQLKLGYDCIPAEKMRSITKVARLIAEIVQVDNLRTKPYVGKFAFAHKGGMHVDAFIKNPKTYQHVDPSLVGNCSNILVSDQSGRNNLAKTLKLLGHEQQLNDTELATLLHEIKGQEKQGSQFDLSMPSFELLVLRHLGLFRPHIAIDSMEIFYHTDSSEKTSLFDVTLGLRISDRNGSSQVLIIKKQNISSFLDLAQNIIDEASSHFSVLASLQVERYRIRVIHLCHHTSDRLRIFLNLQHNEQTIHIMGFGSNFLDSGLHALFEGMEYILNTQQRGHS